MKARKYESSLQSALDAYNIPVQVYHSLIDNVNANLATFHRYLKLRKRILGVDTLHYYDLYAPLLSDVDLKYSVDESKQNSLPRSHHSAMNTLPLREGLSPNDGLTSFRTMGNGAAPIPTVRHTISILICFSTLTASTTT